MNLKRRGNNPEISNLDMDGNRVHIYFLVLIEYLHSLSTIQDEYKAIFGLFQICDSGFNPAAGNQIRYRRKQSKSSKS